MNEKTCYPRNRDVILNRAKDYYKNEKERLREQVKDKYRNLSEEESKKREYGKNRYHNMPEEKKQRLRNIKKITMRLKSLNIIIPKIVLIVYAVIYAN